MNNVGIFPILPKCYESAFILHALFCQTVNSVRYIDMLKRFKASLLQRRADIDTQWFMQDGATAHTALASRQWLRENFEERVVSLKTDFEWAPYSPDINPLDFFLWGYLKDCVHSDKPNTIEEFKNSIIHHMRRVDGDANLCQRVIGNFGRRLAACTERNGSHLEHLL